MVLARISLIGCAEASALRPTTIASTVNKVTVKTVTIGPSVDHCDRGRAH